MKDKFQSFEDGMRMAGGSIQHPLSIHSASIGRRWHSRGMQLICTLVLLFTFAIGNVWADETFSFTFSSSVKPQNGLNCIKDDLTYGSLQCTKASSNRAIIGKGQTITFRAAEGFALKTITLTWRSGASYAPTLSKLSATNATVSSITSISCDANATEVVLSHDVNNENSQLTGVSLVYTTSGGGGGCTEAPAAPTKFEAGSITENGVTFTITDAADAASYDIYYSTSSATPESTATATATSTAKTKAITGLTASTEYFAWVRSVCDDTHKSAWVALTGGSFTTSAPDPCHKYFWFSKAADATTAGVTNNEGGFFTTSASGSNETTSSITIDEVEYAITNRTGNIGADDATIVSFTIPANKAGVLYVNMASSGNKGESSSRTLYLKKGGVTIVTATNAIYGDGAQHNATIENIPSGTYTLHANNNVKVGMFAVKVCDATYHTISFDSDEGSSVASLSVLDGTAATKPADPTKANCDFVKWVVKSSGADYNWSANVTADIALKAVWAAWPTLTLKAGEGATGSDITSQHQAGSSVEVPAKPEGFSNGTKNFDGWTYSAAVTSIDETHFEMPASDLTLTAKWVSAASVARIGETEYATFAEALDHHADGTIVLLQNVELDAMLSVNYDLALDLNGNTLSRDDASAKLIEVYGGATLTITGTAANSEFIGRINLGRATNSNGNLVINGGYYHVGNGQTVLHVNGTCLASNVTITNATFVSLNDNAIQLNGAGAFNISNSTFTGKTGIYLKAGVLTLTACTVNGKGTYTDYTFYQNGSNPTGDAIVVDACGYPGEAPTINIVSGTYNSEYGSALAYYHPQGDPAVGGVTGGTFNSEVPAALCAPNYAPKDNGDGTYGVKPLAQSINLATYAQSHTGTAWQGYLTDNGYAYVVGSESKAEISLDNSNAFDRGLKLKQSTTSNISFEVAAGKLITIVTGKVNGLSIAINGAAATAIAGGTDAEHLATSYYYNAAAQNVVITETNTGYNIIREIKIENPYEVSFDPNGGNPVASQTFYGTALILPSAVNGTSSLVGWFDADDNKIGEAGESYTPTANITLVAHWEAVSTDARLASISFSSDAGTLEPTFDPEVVNYTYTMPYGTAAVPTITGATSVSAKAKTPVIDAQAANWGDVAHIHGVAESDDTKDYYITMKIAPKDGVCLVKADLAAGSSAASITATSGAYKDADNIAINVAKDLKLGEAGNYVKVAVKDTYFQDGDVVEITLASDKNASAWLQIFADEGTTLVAEMKSGVTKEHPNYLTISGVPANTSALYLYRTEAADGNMNPYPTSMAVYRAMNPVLTAITIDERAGVIDAMDDKHFNVLIPYEADLAALTIVPTIVRNAAHATTPEAVISNEGAWIEGDNTYRVMDKDGDYTDYTITLTRDVLKHTVSFNTHGGSAVASVEVEHNAYLTADQAPADPTKAENEFQYWSLTEGGEEVDITTVQITENKEFHAVWAAEPEGIKLFDGEGNLNTTDFISPAKTTIEIDEVDYPCLAAFASNRSENLKEAKQADLVMYSATTDATKIKFDLYNNASSAKTAYLWLVEEGDENATPIDAVEVPGNTRISTAYYTFNGTKNRSFYLTSGAKADIKVLQAKVIESGASIHQFGQAGYEVNFNKGRIAVGPDSTVHFEGASIHSNENYGVLNTQNLKPKTYIQFNNAVANTIVKITKASSNKYYVTNDLENKGDEYSTDKEIVLTATGTWYIGSVNSNSVAALSKIEFIAPKCAEPAFNALANSDICEGSSYEELDGTATVADAGVPTYQWYREDDSEIAGATNAKYTPTADGKYYVIAVNHLAGYTDNEKKSALVTVTSHASAVITTAPSNVRKDVGTDVTLTVVATGKDLHYAWKECATIDGTYTDVAGATDAASLDITVGAGVKYYKVVVSSACGDPVEAISKVEEWVEVAQVNVTTSTVWEWNNAVEAADESSVAESGAAIQGDPNTYTVLANVEYIHMDDDFKSNALVGKAGLIAWRSSSYKAFQGSGDAMLKFHTTVAGKVRILTSSSNKNKDTEIKINDYSKVFQTTGGGRSAAIETEWVEVPADADVVIGAGASQSLRIYRIEFFALAHQRTSGYNVGDLGTVCLEDATFIEGASLYKLAGLDEHGYLAFDEILSGELEAGKPYLFEVTNPSKISFYKPVGAAHSDEEIATNGMIGTFGGTTLYQNAAQNYYYFSGRHIWRVNDFTVSIAIPAYRCYVDMDVLLNTPAPAPAPGRRRITLGRNSEQVVTGFENLNAGEQAVKLIIDGKMYILRGEKMYDATGKLVK